MTNKKLTQQWIDRYEDDLVQWRSKHPDIFVGVDALESMIEDLKYQLEPKFKVYIDKNDGGFGTYNSSRFRYWCFLPFIVFRIKHGN